MRDAFVGALALDFVIALIAGAPLLHAQVQQPLTMHREVIHGRVTSDGTHGLANIDVIITRAPDRVSLQTLTDSTGNYSITFDQGTGDYLVHVSGAGMETVRKRVTRTGADSVFVVDVMLKRADAEQLAAVNVTATKPTPSRHDYYGLGAGAGAMAHTVDGVNGSVTPDLAGNIAAMAATVATALVTADGVSAAGVAAQQNSTTLNGMSFPGADIPRDVSANVTVRTSAYDPAIGWFGGVQREVSMGGGFPLTFRSAHLTLDTPAMQYTDRYSRELGQQFTNFDASLGGGGNLPSNEKLEYNFGVEGRRRVADGISLASATDDVLEGAAVAPDSAERLLGALNAIGLPARKPMGRATNTGMFLGSIGSRDRAFPSYKTVKTVWNVAAYGKMSRTDDIVSSPTSTSDYSGTTSEGIASLNAHLSTYMHDVYLLDATSAISTSHTRTRPSRELPSGVVFLGSELSDGSSGFSDVAFGGNGGLASALTLSTWETAADLKLYAPGSATHRVSIAADSRLDSWRRAGSSNSLGMFTFNSIGDVEANNPTSFTRTLNAGAQAASIWNGFISVGDWWHKSDAFQLLYGARLEGNRFLSAPAYNPAVARAFGLRTDFAPNTIHLSPRIGFTYVTHNEAGSMDDALGRMYSGPTGYWRGGVGEFRSLTQPALVGGVMGRSGLASGARTIACVGSATPTPMWSRYATDPSLIPTDCIGGAAQSAFADAAPTVELLDRSYTAPRSWRANLAYGSMVRRLVYSIEGAYSLNLDQPGQTDLNFSNRPQFVTSDEGRPVYVGSDAIVPGSGVLVSTSSRRDSSFGRVIDHVSSLRSVNRQLTFTLSPDLQDLTGWFASLAYTIADTRSLTSGFDNSAFASPLTREWARSNFDVRHRFVFQGGVTRNGFTFTLFGRVQSGFPFTPLVGADVNGDGLANDRAFIFDPLLASDSSVAAGMRSLLQSSQPNIRDCISRQLRRAAAVNSCEGPWTAAVNAQVDYAFKFPGTRHGAHVTVAFTNPLGGLDQVLHGADHLHGWGTRAVPDPVLYNVRGFDPISRKFNYIVNSRFGDTRPRAGVARVPFGITLDFAINLAPPTDWQVADLLLKPGRNGHPGTRMNAATVRHLYDVANPNPFQAILGETDSLMLSRAQEDALTRASDEYDAHRDTIMTALVTYLTGIGDHYSVSDVVERQDELLEALWDLGHVSIRKALPGILNRYQLRMLPYPAHDFYMKPASVTGKDIISH
jgi:hypothetical protein